MPSILILRVRWPLKQRGVRMLLFLKHQILCLQAAVLYFFIKIHSPGTLRNVHYTTLVTWVLIVVMIITSKIKRIKEYVFSYCLNNLTWLWSVCFPDESVCKFEPSFLIIIKNIVFFANSDSNAIIIYLSVCFRYFLKDTFPARHSSMLQPLWLNIFAVRSLVDLWRLMFQALQNT